MYNWILFDHASALAYKALKRLKQPTNDENIEIYTKIAIMFIKTRHESDIEAFLKFYDSISFPKLERIKKLDLFESFLNQGERSD